MFIKWFCFFHCVLEVEDVVGVECVCSPCVFVGLFPGSTPFVGCLCDELVTCPECKPVFTLRQQVHSISSDRNEYMGLVLEN